MPKKKKFGGELDERLPPLRLGPFMDDETARKAIADHTALEFRKLELLETHYGLKARDYVGLSLALAREFVDGFKEAKPRGRLTKWDNLVLGLLFVEIERKRIERRLRRNNSEIYSAVAKQAPWDSFGGRGCSNPLPWRRR